MTVNVFSRLPRWWRASMVATVSAIVAVSLQIQAQQPPPSPRAQGGRARTPATGEIEVLHVRGQVYLMASAAGNAAVQVGPQGVLVVDTMTEPLADRLVAAIEQLAPGKPIRYVLNTHAHPDHTGGNAVVAAAGSQLVAGNFARELGQVGAQSAFIVAHENVLKALSTPASNQPAAPFAAWPTDTFFQERKDMYFNGEAVQLLHMPGAHTDGDALVFFRSSDVICAGDVYVTTGFPRIDLARGGHVNGVIEALNQLVDLAVSEQFTEGGTQVIPGHGRISDELDVVEYRDMVTIIRDRVQDMIRRGFSLDQVKSARPALDWDSRYGSERGPWTTAMFVEAVYRNLSR
jgi:glyoxylase-like metal-dependent hydrolase (beta-lactamase superfamily II)